MIYLHSISSNLRNKLENDLIHIDSVNELKKKGQGAEEAAH